MERVEARVEGRVQGVCFRYYTRRRATELELSGWVKNQPDGSVRVLAEGPRDRLDQLLSFLHQGPEAARVDRVTTDWQPHQGDLSPFSVAR
jgi:acylphosphatase